MLKNLKLLLLILFFFSIIIDVKSLVRTLHLDSISKDEIAKLKQNNRLKGLVLNHSTTIQLPTIYLIFHR